MRNKGIARRKADIADPHGARYEGELSLSETTDQGLHRLCVVATHRYFDSLYTHQLFDARLVWIEGQRLMLTGFERVKSEFGVIEYAQSWLCLVDDVGNPNAVVKNKK